MAFYRATVQGHIGTDEIWNFTLHAEHTTGDAASLATLFAEGVTLLWVGPPTPANSIQQLVPTTVGVDEIVVDELDSAGRNVNQARASLPMPGTDANEILPPQCAVAVSVRTGLPTRAGRGRFYLPPFAVDTVSAERLDHTARDQIGRAAQAMLQHINTGLTTGLVVYHRGRDSGDLITSCDVGDVYDTQRRRRDQLGEERISFSV